MPTLVEQSVEVPCANCGIVFWITVSFWKARRESHEGFYCPRGHTLSYGHETEREKFRRLWHEQQEQTRMANVDKFDAERKKVRAERKLKRIEKGTCHKCKRHFTNVERHMKSQHGKRKRKTH